MRIDKYIAEKYGSRTKAARAVEQGLVLVNGKTVAPSYEMGERDVLSFFEAEESYVSLGGYKLAKALKDFGYSPRGKIFADIGASTGGFTDCLLQNGAKKVYCIDVGKNQLDSSIKQKNVVIIDEFNARELSADMFFDELDGAVIDVSFISLTYVLDKVGQILKDGKHVIALIKPQFELENKNVGKNGIVNSPQKREAAIDKIYAFAVQNGLAPQKLTAAPVISGKNTEYLILLEKGGTPVDIKIIKKPVKI